MLRKRGKNKSITSMLVMAGIGSFQTVLIVAQIIQPHGRRNSGNHSIVPVQT